MRKTENTSVPRDGGVFLPTDNWAQKNPLDRGEKPW